MFDSQVPVIEINRENYEKFEPLLLAAIQSADIIALDLELSGIGRRSRRMDAGQKFANIANVVKTRSILSLGIATFMLKPHTADAKVVPFECSVFNLLVMSAEPYTSEPDSLEFLRKHGFDFNKLIHSAIQYWPSKKTGALSNLFSAILSSSASVICHNGFVDLCFLYGHLFAPLPDVISVFQACLRSLFTGPVDFYDTKLLASEHDGNTTLEYVFRKLQRFNVLEYQGARAYVAVSFATNESMPDIGLSPGDVQCIDCEMSTSFLKKDFFIDAATRDQICQNYANHGFCRSQDKCPKIHDVDLVLDYECYQAGKKRRLRKRRFAHITANNKTPRTQSRELPPELVPADDQDDDCESTSTGATYERSKFAMRGCHRAGMDAFMTGFAALVLQRMDILNNCALDPQKRNRTLFAGATKPILFTGTSDAGYAPHVEAMEKLAFRRAAKKKDTKNIRGSPDSGAHDFFDSDESVRSRETVPIE